MGFLSTNKNDTVSQSPSTASSSPDRSTSVSPSRQPSALKRLYWKLSPKKTTSGEDEIRDSPPPSVTSSAPTSSIQLRQVFEHFDENGDGRISPAELRSCVNALGGDLSQEEADMAVESSDSDGDGLLGYEEFERMVDGCGEEERFKDLKEAFEMYESERSGCITAASLKQMLGRLGEKRSTEDCKAMIGAFDLNGDGVLNFDEFRVMMR